MKSVLNVGGRGKTIDAIPHYAGWRHHLVDARRLQTLPPKSYDAVYCSHHLQHFYRHEGASILRGFDQLLGPGGFVEIHVHNLAAVFEHVVRNKLDIDDKLYDSSDGPILVHDVLFGFSHEIEKSGWELSGHRTGFSPKSLRRFLSENGFPFDAVVFPRPFEICGYFFREQPSEENIRLLSLPR